MAYINGHKVISVVRTIYQSELDLIARYHLGVADSLDVSDGITTITRKTGYVECSKLNWSYNSTYRIMSAPVPNKVSSTGAPLEISKGRVVPASTSLANMQDGDCRAYYFNYPTDIVYKTSETDVTAFKQSMQGAYLQYETTLSYIELVPNERPLNTLDQNGSQWLRSEWLKGLNLLNKYDWLNGYYDYITPSNQFVATNTRITKSIYLKSGTYTFIADSDISLRIDIVTNQTYQSNVLPWYDNLPTPKTFTIETSGYYQFIIASKGGTWNINGSDINVHHCMLVECDHAYSFQEWNGELIHRKDIEPVLLWENASPDATYSYGDITLDTAITNYKYLVIAYREKQYGAIHYTKIKTASSIPNGYLIGAAQISGNEQGVCRSFTISTSGTKISFYNDKVYGGSSGYGYYCIPIAIYGTDVL